MKLAIVRGIFFGLIILMLLLIGDRQKRFEGVSALTVQYLMDELSQTNIRLSLIEDELERMKTSQVKQPSTSGTLEQGNQRYCGEGNEERTK